MTNLERENTYSLINLTIPLLLATFSMFVPRVTDFNFSSFIVFFIAPAVAIYSIARLAYLSHKQSWLQKRHYFILAWYGCTTLIFYTFLRFYKAVGVQTRTITVYKGLTADDMPDTIGEKFNIYLLEDAAYILFGLSCVYLLLFLWRKKEYENLQYAVQAFYLTFVVANYIYVGHSGLYDR